MIELCCEDLSVRCIRLYVFIMSRTRFMIKTYSQWLSVPLWTKWLWIRVQMQSLKLQYLHLLWAKSPLTFGYYRVDSLKRVREMIKIYTQMHRTDNYSQHSSMIMPLWPSDWVFIYELSGCGFESSCSHLNLRFCAYFEQRVPWHSGNCRVWIHSERCTWHRKKIQSNAP